MGPSIFWIFSLFVISVFSTSNAIQNCNTPLYKSGVCEHLRKCPAMLQLLLQAGSLTVVEDYYKKSHCGGLITDPKVCCPTNIHIPGIDVMYENPENNPVSHGYLTHPLLPRNCGRGTTKSHENYLGTAAIDDFPWLALLEYDQLTDGQTKSFCTGSLISDRYVLTAAHCFEEYKVDFKLARVRLGEYDRSTERDCAENNLGDSVCSGKTVSVEVAAIIIHEDYRKDTHGLRNDIALLRLSKSVKFSDYIQPICLPSIDKLPQEFLSTGWGLIDGILSRKFKNILPLVGKDVCSRDYRGSFDNILKSHICVGVNRKYLGCKRDEGGPLMSLQSNGYEDGRWICEGVFSFGSPNCGIVSDRESGIYTNVNQYTTWIMNHLV